MLNILPLQGRGVDGVCVVLVVLFKPIKLTSLVGQVLPSLPLSCFTSVHRQSNLLSGPRVTFDCTFFSSQEDPLLVIVTSQSQLTVICLASQDCLHNGISRHLQYPTQYIKNASSHVKSSHIGFKLYTALVFENIVVTAQRIWIATGFGIVENPA